MRRRNLSPVIRPVIAIFVVGLCFQLISQYGANVAIKTEPARVPVATATATKPATPATSTTTNSPLVVKNLSLRDEDGRTIYQGEINLRPTIDRIAAGRKLRFSHDGSTFQNREGRLPREASGYYREWVVPTPGDDGPGPQRLVTGEAGEVWYTADHYRSFRRIPVRIATP